VCRREIPKCEKCAEGHEMKECVVPKNMSFSKVGILAFIAMVVSCTAEISDRYRSGVGLDRVK
jgi:hypothetical protein